MLVFVAISLFYYAMKITLREIKSVTRFLSTCGPEDEVFDADNSLKQQIESEQLEKIVTTIENKLSIGMIEKRQ